MNAIALALPLMALVASSAMGAAIVARDPGLRIHLLLGAILGATAWWSLCEVLWQLQTDPEDVIFCVRLSSLGWMALGPLCLHVFSEISGSPPAAVRRAVPLSYAAAALGVIVYQVTPALERVVHSEWGWGYEVGPLFLVPYAIAVTPASSVLLLWHHLAPGGAVAGGEQRVSRWMYVGVCVALAVTLMTEVLLPALGIQWLHLGTTSIAGVAVLCAVPMNRYGFSLLSPAAFAQEILSTLSDGVALLYVDGRIRFANRALGDLAGVDPSALVGRSVDDLLPGAQEALAGCAEPVELELLAADGSRVPVAVSAVRLGRPPSTSLVIHDLREARDLRDRILTAGRLATVGELSTAIAREVQVPAERVEEHLHALYALWRKIGRTARREAPEDPETAELLSEGLEVIGDCIEGVARVRAIAREVGSFEHGQDQIPRAEDLNAVVENALRVADARLPARIRVERDLAELPPVVCVARELGQVVLNLVLNAADALEGVGNVWVRTGTHGASAWIEVSDDGPGISPDLRQRMFDPFFTTKPVGEGTGLGLAISFHIVERHGGELACDSEPGAGARFRVSLPLDARRPAPAPAEAAPDRRGAPRGRGGLGDRAGRRVAGSDSGR